MPPIALFDLAVGFIVAFLASYAVCRVMVQSGPIDKPDAARKNHAAPTPTSGGVGVAAGLAVGLVVLVMLPNAWRDSIMPEGVRLLSRSLIFAYVFLFLGFIDDIWPLEPRLKIAVFMAIALAAANATFVVATLPFGEYFVLQLPFALGLAGTALWIFVLVNVVNFTDGVNGLAMGSMAVAMLALAAVSFVYGSASGSGIALCAAGALGGFLIWNAPAGRLFAGDAGALFVGALGALVSLLVIRRTGVSAFVPALAVLPLLADSILTILWRLAGGAKLLEGHSEHIYQLLVRKAGWSHVRTARLYWLATALCAAAAFGAAMYSHGAYACFVFGFFLLVAVAIVALVRARLHVAPQ